MKNSWILVLLFLGCGTFSLDAQTPTSYFTVGTQKGRDWFLTPAGKPFLSMGVNAIGDQSYRAPNDLYYDPVKKQYQGDKKSWTRSVMTRLRKWRFNTIGSWSDEDLLGRDFPFTYMLYIARGSVWDRVLDSVFTPDFEALVKTNAQKAVKYRNDPNLIGYFLDNELPWWGEFGWRTGDQKTLLEKYAASGIEDPNKDALKKFFEDRYQGNVDKFNDLWKVNLQSFEDFDGAVTLMVRTRQQKAEAEAWAGVVAERYFSVTTQALRAVDPHHLILGVRFAGEAPWDVVAACGKYCDVVSVNHYAKSGDIDKTLMDNFYVKGGKPILITEYSFSSMENQSGDPNSHGADVSVPTQKDRAEHLHRYATQMLSLPYIVGLHWFEWSDESPKGRFDGEDCDYGLVDTQDKEYSLLTLEHTRINRDAQTFHAKAESARPTSFAAEGREDYRKAPPGTKVPDSRPFLWIDRSLVTYPWADTATGGQMEADTSSGDLALNFKSGTGWGCGLSCPPNVMPLLEKNVVDLTGYNFLQFKAFVPKDVKFVVYIAESGDKDKSSPDFTGVNGADGECYFFPGYTGTGKWETYKINLEDLELRTEWGNQHGNRILDMQAIAHVDFYIPGLQGGGKILVKDMEFLVH